MKKMLWTKTGKEKTEKYKKYIECKCVCGLIKWVKVANYGVCSFGCRKCRFGKSNRTHGMSKTKLHKVYRGMIDRCYYPSSKSYERYGARGITICKEWVDNSESFFKWSQENGYKQGLSIDRIDNEKGYSPGNCRWVTQEQQVRNMRNNVYHEIDGQRMLLRDWARFFNLNPDTVKSRTYRGYTNNQALGLEERKKK